ncbi:MAG: NTP transferase domain-containing protein [Planctomycetes bacterium]|nr:NTP transferase domain-containing protein [Planctomycetota bacterium]
MEHSRRIGVILAAGRGARMGGTKQLSIWQTSEGPKPLVAATYDSIRPICDQMIVVLGHEADAVAAALGERRFHRVNSNPDAPMFESIRAGLRVAQSIDPFATAVVHPGDHPEVAASTLIALTDCSFQQPVQAVIAQFDNRGGHPALIPPVVAALLLEADCPQGLGEFWLAHPDLCVRVPVDDPSVLRDVDLPSDLANESRE